MSGAGPAIVLLVAIGGVALSSRDWRSRGLDLDTVPDVVSARGRRGPCTVHAEVKVAIDIRRVSGGKAAALRCLVSSLGILDDGPDEYVLVVRSEADLDWLTPLARNQQHRVLGPSHSSLPRRIARRIGALRDRTALAVPRSNGFYEALKCDVVHFPVARFTLCAVPSVYSPHDLQHVHYPQFFKPGVAEKREAVHAAACRRSKTVIVNFQRVKEDVARHYRVSAARIQVIPEAPRTSLLNATSDLAAIRIRYGLDHGFVFYPSITWPHKNHVRLLDAIALVRTRLGRSVQLVCSGVQYDPHWPAIEARVAELSLGDQVRFLGFLPQEDLPALYQLAGCLVLPTLFEANSLPMFEAWREGTPVVSSNVTALPEQAGGAALLFDPFDTAAMADAIVRVLTDQALAADLRACGCRRLQDFDWTRTARAYRAVYRRAAGQALSNEDEALLH